MVRSDVCLLALAMSALGQERTLTGLSGMSALRGKADVIVGKADIGRLTQ